MWMDSKIEIEQQTVAARQQCLDQIFSTDPLAKYQVLKVCG